MILSKCVVCNNARAKAKVLFRNWTGIRILILRKVQNEWKNKQEILKSIKF